MNITSSTPIPPISSFVHMGSLPKRKQKIKLKKPLNGWFRDTTTATSSKAKMLKAKQWSLKSRANDAQVLPSPAEEGD